MLCMRPGPYLRERTTLRLGGRARGEVVLTCADEVPALPELLAGQEARPLILGRGSNILALDGDLPVVLVISGFGDSPQVLAERDGETEVSVGAGYPLLGLLRWAAGQGLAGLEGLAGIPGSVGGAVAMNAGSYGCETGDKLSAVRIFTPAGGLVWRSKAEIGLGYRHFAPMAAHEPAPDWFVITEARFVLPCGQEGAIREAIRANTSQKAATQPIGAHSAGCVFKNPAPGVSAGQLLDQAGFKGKRLGGMMFSDLHANFLINLGNGTGEEAMALLLEAREQVSARFGYQLEWEVKVIGHGL